MIRYVLVVGLYRQDQRLYSCMKVMLSYSINTELVPADTRGCLFLFNKPVNQ